MLRQDRRGRGNYSSNVDIGTILRHIHACYKTSADDAGADRSQLANMLTLNFVFLTQMLTTKRRLKN